MITEEESAKKNPFLKVKKLSEPPTPRRARGSVIFERYSKNVLDIFPVFIENVIDNMLKEVAAYEDSGYMRVKDLREKKGGIDDCRFCKYREVLCREREVLM